MYANEFWQQRTAPQGSTIATRPATPQDIRRALPDLGVDYKVELQTEKE